MTATASPARERVQLNNRQPVSRTTIHGWPSFFFGLPFAGMGTFILLMGLGKIEVDPGKVHAPMWIIALFGLLFVLAGLSFIWHGLGGVRRKAKIKIVKTTRASSPWLWDYEWQALGISDNKLKKVMHGLIMLIVVGAFLAPFHWWAFVSDEGSIMVKAMVVFFDLVFGLGGGYYFLNNLALFMKYGNCRLRFSSFPFLLVDTLSVVLVGLPSEINQLQLDLRFIEEQYETRGSGRNKESRVVCYQLYHEERILKGREVASSGKLSLEWGLPNE
ncbi:MAG: hypothetical protein V3T82_04535, partial [Nitrospinaceae bacterium]